MPNQCRQNILNCIEQEKADEKSFAFGWETTAPTVKKPSWRLLLLVLAILLLTALITTPRQSVTCLPQTEPIEMFADPQTADVSNTTESRTADSKATATDNITQKQLYYRSLNSALYLEQLSGTIRVYDHAQPDTVLYGSFSLDYTTDTYYAQIHTRDAVYENQTYATTTYYNNCTQDGLREMYILYDLYEEGETAYTYVPFVSHEAEEARVSDTEIEEMSVDEITNAFHPDERTGIEPLTICFAPRQWALDYLSDFSTWSISNIWTDDLSGTLSETRTLVTIEGSDDAGNFEIIVDRETGIWLEFYRYDAYSSTSVLSVENLNFHTDDSEFTVSQLSEAEKTEIEHSYTNLPDVYVYGAENDWESKAVEGTTVVIPVHE